jgi:hypothetical protein
VVRGSWTDLVAARVSEVRQAATNASPSVVTKGAIASSGTKARCATWQWQSLLWAEVRGGKMKASEMKGSAWAVGR